MTYKIAADALNARTLDTHTLQNFEMGMSTIALIDDIDKTYETMPLYQFFEANPETFTPYETCDLIATLFMTGKTTFAAGTGQTYTIALIDLCDNNPDTFEFTPVEHDVDPLEGMTDKDPFVPAPVAPVAV